MGFCKLRIQLQCSLGGTDYFRTHLTRGNADENQAEAVVGTCQTDVSRGKGRVLPDRLFEVGNALFDLRPTVAHAVSAFEIALVDFRRD